MTIGQRLLRWSLALALGAGGGAAFWSLSLPLPWMLGAMMATTAGALAGLPMAVPAPLRTVMLSVLGVMLGSSITPQVLSDAARWPITLAGMAIYLASGMALVMGYFRRVAGYGPVTAYFAAAPGGLNEMVMLGAAKGGDAPIIALNHTLRILLIVFTVPTAFRLFGGYEGGGALSFARLVDLSLADALILAAAAAGGSVGGRLLRLPAHHLVGPMLASAAVHLTGLTALPPPAEVVSTAQVVLGAAIGSRFAGEPLARLGKSVLTAAGATFILVALSLAFTAGLAPVAGMSMAALLLAFVPGGLAEMSLVAIALGVDVAFVAVHHISRVLLVVMLAPLAFRAWHRGDLGNKPGGDRAD